MKKNTSKDFSKRLVQYGALSVAALGVADVAGQVIYTDVDPDVVLNVGDVFSIDLNGDTMENLNASNPDGLAGGNAALVFPSSGGAFVGITAGGFEYPALLAEGDTIDDASGYTADGVRGDMNYYGCAYSSSQWCGTIVDGYLGVRFTFGGDVYYGWVRMDTDVNGSNLMVVKDFAYESTPGEGILAGQILAAQDFNSGNFDYFVDVNNQLVLSSSTPMNSVEVFNLQGQAIINQELNSTNEIIDLASFASGVYLATITIDKSRKTVKIVKK